MKEGVTFEAEMDSVRIETYTDVDYVLVTFRVPLRTKHMAADLNVMRSWNRWGTPVIAHIELDKSR